MGGSISHTMILVLFGLADEVEFVYDPDPFSGMLDAARNLKSVLMDRDQFIAGMTENEIAAPPKVHIQAKRTPILTVEHN